MISLLKFIVSIVWLLLTIGVLVNLWRDKAGSGSSKVLWTLGILIFPILGPVLFLLFGARTE
jgi:hypothetical protein